MATKTRLEIDTRTFIRFWLVVIGFVLALLAINHAMGAIVIILAAAFLAVVLNPPVSKLAKVIPGRSRVLSTAVSFVVVVAILGAIVTLIVPAIAQETAKAGQALPEFVQTVTTQYQGVSDFITEYNLTDQVDSFVNSVKESSTEFLATIGSNIVVSIGALLTAISTIILTLVLAFFMLIEGPTWMKKIWASYRDEEKMKHHKSIVTKIYGVITGYATGQLTVSAIAGTVAGVGIFLLSLFFPVSASLAIPSFAIVFVLSLIPMFGAIISAVLISIVLLFSSVTAAIIFLVGFIIYQQLEGNYISPKIQSKRIELTPLIILASVTIGIYLFGIAGGIISIPVAGICKVFFEEYLADREKKRELGAKTA